MIYKGKKILLISPRFFGYEAEIERELINLGATVDFYDERPFSSSVAKIANRLNFKFFIKNAISQHYAAILEKASSIQYHYMLVISPETMDIKFVRGLRRYVQMLKQFYIYGIRLLIKRTFAPFSMPLIKRLPSIRMTLR